MKVLYFCPHALWPLTTGARLRDYHCARQLAHHAEVIFVQMGAPGDLDLAVRPTDSPFAAVCTLRKEGSYTLGKLIRGFAGPIPLTVLNYFSAQAASQLKQILDQHGPFDTIQMEGVHLSAYLPILKASGAPIVADWHNIESELMWRFAEREANPAKKLVAYRTAKLLERSEADMVANAAVHTVASERERDILTSRLPGVRVQVIPNGVDTAFYRNDSARPQGVRRSVLFVGSMDYHANVDAVQWFAADAWPLIARSHPELQFTVAGRNPAASIRALANSRIAVTGTVDDIRPYYRDSFAVVVPLRVGSGTRLKILEAMAAGIPVISTRLGAEGIDAIPDKHILIADTAAAMAAAVQRLQEDPILAARLAEDAYQLMQSRYDWSTIGSRLFQLHSEALSRAKGKQ